MNGGGKEADLNKACMDGNLREAIDNWTGDNENVRYIGYTPLINTITQFRARKKQDYLDVFYWLLNNTNVDVDKRDREGKTALHHVLERSCWPI